MEDFSNTTEKMDALRYFFGYVYQRPIIKGQAGPPAATIGGARNCQSECKNEESVMLCCPMLIRQTFYSVEKNHLQSSYWVCPDHLC